MFIAELSALLLAVLVIIVALALVGAVASIF